jgi:hypothetical protein
MRSLVTAFSITVLIFLLMPACKPSVGGSCSEDRNDCTTPTSHFVCLAGHYGQETCKGAKGCKVENDKVACDTSRADEGDPCTVANKIVCTSDGKAKVKCENQKFVFLTKCGGVEGCSVQDQGEAFCSHPFADVGDPCKEGEGACSDDQTYDLVCTGGKMARRFDCHGEEKCTPRSAGPVCDRSVAKIGEPCDEKDPELSIACAPDLTTALVCKAGKLVQGPMCRGEYKCGVARYGIDGRRHFKSECDQSIADVGEECLKELKPACASDLKAKLFCQNGKFVEERKCKLRCEVHSVPEPFECKDKEDPPPTTPKKK